MSQEETSTTKISIQISNATSHSIPQSTQNNFSEGNAEPKKKMLFDPKSSRLVEISGSEDKNDSASFVSDNHQNNDKRKQFKRQISRESVEGIAPIDTGKSIVNNLKRRKDDNDDNNIQENITVDKGSNQRRNDRTERSEVIWKRGAMIPNKQTISTYQTKETKEAESDETNEKTNRKAPSTPSIMLSRSNNLDTIEVEKKVERSSHVVDGGNSGDGFETERSSKVEAVEEAKKIRTKERLSRKPRTQGWLFRYNENHEIEQVLYDGEVAAVESITNTTNTAFRSEQDTNNRRVKTMNRKDDAVSDRIASSVITNKGRRDGENQIVNVSQSIHTVSQSTPSPKVAWQAQSDTLQALGMVDNVPDEEDDEFVDDNEDDYSVPRTQGGKRTGVEKSFRKLAIDLKTRGKVSDRKGRGPKEVFESHQSRSPSKNVRIKTGVSSSRNRKGGNQGNQLEAPIDLTGLGVQKKFADDSADRLLKASTEASLPNLGPINTFPSHSSLSDELR
jgi:hypothetical protein